MTTWEDSDISILEQRIELIEEVLNSVQTALNNNVPNLDQVRQLMLLKEKTLTEISDKLDTLWDMVILIKNEVYK